MDRPDAPLPLPAWPLECDMARWFLLDFATTSLEDSNMPLSLAAAVIPRMEAALSQRTGIVLPRFMWMCWTTEARDWHTRRFQIVCGGPFIDRCTSSSSSAGFKGLEMGLHLINRQDQAGAVAGLPSPGENAADGYAWSPRLGGSALHAASAYLGAQPPGTHLGKHLHGAFPEVWPQQSRRQVHSKHAEAVRAKQQV